MIFLQVARYSFSVTRHKFTQPHLSHCTPLTPKLTEITEAYGMVTEILCPLPLLCHRWYWSLREPNPWPTLVVSCTFFDLPCENWRQLLSCLKYLDLYQPFSHPATFTKHLAALRLSIREACVKTIRPSTYS